MRIAIIILLIFSCQVIFSQKALVEKALILNDELYIGSTRKGAASYLRGFNKNNNIQTNSCVRSSIASSIYDLPFCWDVVNRRTLGVSIIHDIRYSPKFVLTKDFILDTDSAFQINESKKLGRLYAKKWPDPKERFIKVIQLDSNQRYFSNQRYLPPLKALYEKTEGIHRYIYIPSTGESVFYNSYSQHISYDICANDTAHIDFYIRDFEKLSVWRYYFRPIQERGLRSDWREVKTYTDKENEEECWKEIRWQHGRDFSKDTSYLPNYKNYIFNAFPDTLVNFQLMAERFTMLWRKGILPKDVAVPIALELKRKIYTADTTVRKELGKLVGEEKFRKYKRLIYKAAEKLFFKGHFKVIRQGKETFIVNQQYGGIYWMGPTEIWRVGQLDMKAYTRRLKGKLLFIEDRDKERLIFFAPIERLNKDKPFPKTKIILDDKEFNKMFKYVIEE